MANTYLFGASGHGKVVKDILNANGVKVEAFVDDNLRVDECAGRPVLHDALGLSPMIVSIGVNRVRKIVVERLVADAKANENTLEFATAIHPSAIIGKHCIVNTGATVDHDCVIGDYCHVAPGVHVSGGTLIGEGTWIGVGACVIQCLNIGRDCMIGAGSVVVNDIPDGVTAYGNPCRVRTKEKQDNNMINNNLTSVNRGGQDFSYLRSQLCLSSLLA